MRRVNIVFLGCAGLLLLGGCQDGEITAANDLVELLPDNANLVAQGREIYAQTCAICHGASLEGQADWRIRNEQGLLPAPPHDETGHTWHHTDQALFDLTKFGLQKYAGQDYESDMPAYEGTLTDTEIIAVLSYIKSEWPENIKRRHDGVNAQYRAAQVQNNTK